MYPKQYGKIHLIIPGAAPVHRQRPVLVSLVRQASVSQPARGLSGHSQVRAGRRKAKPALPERRLSVRVHGLLGSIHRTPAPAERGLLQQTIGRAHQRRRLWPRAKSLGDLRVSQPGGLPRPLPPYGRPPPGRCLRDLSEDLLTAVWIGSRPLLHQPRPLLGCAAQENRSRTRATHRL